jgi:hypothetical protein
MDASAFGRVWVDFTRHSARMTACNKTNSLDLFAILVFMVFNEKCAKVRGCCVINCVVEKCEGQASDSE